MIVGLESGKQYSQLNDVISDLKMSIILFLKSTLRRSRTNFGGHAALLF